MLVIGMLLVLGTAGYMLIEGWSFLDALYMTVTTLVTVGFGEIHPLSTTGRIFTIGLIVLGVGGGPVHVHVGDAVRVRGAPRPAVGASTDADED